MLLPVSRLAFCRSDVTSVSLHHTHMREQLRVIERNPDICTGISWTGREQNTDNQQQCSQSHFAFLKWTISVFTWFAGLQSSQAPPLLLSPLFDGLCGCCAMWATSCSPTTCKLQRTTFTSWQTWYEMKKSPVMCRVPLFLPLFFTYLCRLASPSKVSHLLLFWNPRPGVRQTSDPHSVCQICALVLICSCSIFWLLCFQDLQLYSRPSLIPHASQVTNPDTFKHVISIRNIDELNYKAANNSQAIEDIWLLEIYF